MIALKVGPFRKILPPQCERTCGGPGIIVALKRTDFLFVVCAIHQSMVTSKFKRNVLLGMFLLLLQFEYFHTEFIFRRERWQQENFHITWDTILRKLKKTA